MNNETETGWGISNTNMLNHYQNFGVKNHLLCSHFSKSFVKKSLQET